MRAKRGGASCPSCFERTVIVRRTFVVVAAVACVALIVAYLCWFAWALSGPDVFSPGGAVVGLDFVFFWTASAALHGAGVGAVMDPGVLRTFAPYVAETPWYEWVYPPPALLFVSPLAYLPYTSALIAWTCVGVLSYLATSYAITHRPGVLLAAAAFPGVLVTIAAGQVGLFVFALLGGALIALPRRPLLAGVLLGALAIKPHHAMLVPVALLSSGNRKAFATTAISACAITAISTIAFGSDVWTGSLRGIQAARGMLEAGTVVPHFKYASIYAAARLAGVGSAAAYALQGLALVAATGTVAWLWRQNVRAELKAAGLVAANLFGNFYFLHYDLVLLGLVLLFGMRLGRWSTGEWLVLVATWLLPRWSLPIAHQYRVQLAPAVIGAVLFVIIRRALKDRINGSASEAATTALGTNSVSGVTSLGT
jgi:alpha-1,2-mannosyltransferase